MLSGCWNYQPDLLFSCKLLALTAGLNEESARYLYLLSSFLSAPCLCTALPIHFPSHCFFYSPCLSLSVPHDSPCICSHVSTGPVRWNIGALLMIQQSFLHVSVHLVFIVKLLSRADSRQAWFAFNSEAEGDLCGLTSSHPHLLYKLCCSNNKSETNWVGVRCQSPYSWSGTLKYGGWGEW